MTGEEINESQHSQVGWIDLGRFFIFFGLLNIAINLAISGAHALPSWLGTDLPVDLHLYRRILISIGYLLPALGMLAALYFTFRPVRSAKTVLGLSSASIHWFLVALVGWAGITATLAYALGALGREVTGAGRIFGHGWPPTPFGRAPNPGLDLQILLAFCHALPAAIAEVVDRGLVFRALRRYWDIRLAALTSALLSGIFFMLATDRLGLAPIVVLWFVGGLFNCWLAARSDSILPGMVGISATAAYLAMYPGIG